MPAPVSLLIINKRRDGINNQNLKLFIRGNAISGIPIIKGINQFPNPPIIKGMTIKKIIKKACIVTIELYNWSLLIHVPGTLNSIRIIILNDDPTIPAHIAKIKYNIPIYLWFVEYNHFDNLIN